MRIASVLRNAAESINYGGVRPECALDAIRIIGDLSYEHIQIPEIVPRNNGGLQLEWYTERGQIEVYVHPDEATTFWVEEYGYGEYDYSLFGNADKLDGYALKIAPEVGP